MQGKDLGTGAFFGLLDSAASIGLFAIELGMHEINGVSFLEEFSG